MLREYVIPFVKKQLDTSEEISATLDSANIKRIDAMYLPKEAIKRHNEEFKKKLLDAPTDPSQLENYKLPQPFNPLEAQNKVAEDMASLGNQRFFTPSGS